MESTSVQGASQSFLFLCAQDTHNSDGVRWNQLKKKHRSIMLTWAQIFGQEVEESLTLHPFLVYAREPSM